MLTLAVLAVVAVLTFGVWAVAWLLDALGLSDTVPWLYPTRIFPNVWVLAVFFLIVAVIGRAQLRKRYEEI